MADGVSIDLDGVDIYNNNMRNRVDGRLKEAADRASKLHSQGAAWGSKLVLGDIANARQKYVYALAYTEANHRTYVQAAQVLVDVAHQIAKDFAGVDRNSAEAQNKIQDLLSNAVATAQAMLTNSQQTAGVPMATVHDAKNMADTGTVKL